jgi:hypothetical protein
MSTRTASAKASSSSSRDFTAEVAFLTCALRPIAAGGRSSADRTDPC